VSRIVHAYTRDSRKASTSVNSQITARISAAALRRSLPSHLRSLLTAAEATATDRRITLWAVGGAPRDLALGVPINDLDLAIDGDTGRFLRDLASRLPAATTSSVTVFGTASVTLTTPAGTARLDLSRLRAETYRCPGALPEVRWTRSVERDLARRDFTVNAVALGLTGTQRNRVVDPFDGLADIAARRLRVLHARSFEDDATRLWRGARVASERQLRPDAETAFLIVQGGQWASTVSGDRWSGELDLTARRGHGAGVMRLLNRWGVLRSIHPAWALDPRSSRALARHPEPMPAARLAALVLAPLPEAVAVLARLDASGETREAVRDTARLLASPPAPAPEVLATLERAGADARLAARWLVPDRGADWRALDRWGRTKPALSAEEIVALGAPRGPALGRILRELRRARFERTLTAKAAEREFVRRALEREE